MVGEHMEPPTEVYSLGGRRAFVMLLLGGGGIRGTGIGMSAGPLFERLPTCCLPASPPVNRFASTRQMMRQTLWMPPLL